MKGATNDSISIKLLLVFYLEFQADVQLTLLKELCSCDFLHKKIPRQPTFGWFLQKSGKNNISYNLCQ